MPKIHIDNDTYELLLKLKGQKLIRGEKVSISSLVREAVFTVYGTSSEVSKSISGENGMVTNKQVSNEIDVQQQIKEAVKSVDVQKRRFIPATEKQKNYINELCRRLGKPYLEEYEYLSKREADSLIKRLEKEAGIKRS